MIGSGIASSLVHEVGHQAAALLDLIPSLQALLRARHANGDGRLRTLAWRYFDRWLSEIVADFWSVARVGVTSTLGLISVVSLPRVFVFRLNPDDPHPVPWIRVKLSCAMGRALYPHPQWAQLENLWESFYPIRGLAPHYRALLAAFEAVIPDFVQVLLEHRPASLHGRPLREVMETGPRQPGRLIEHYRAWRTSPVLMRDTAPSFAFAVVGQARADRLIGPEEESRTLVDLLHYWALRSTLDDATRSSARSSARPLALTTRALQTTLN